MARLKGGLITSTFDPSKRGPLDSRELVTRYEDLINPAVWITNTTSKESLYDGLRVSVNEAGEHYGIYFLLDRKQITEDNYTLYLAAKEQGQDVSAFFAMWERVTTGEPVYNAKTHFDFPSIGKANVIYKAEDEKKIYQWNTTGLKYEILNDTGSDVLDITLINGGNANG